MLCVAHPPLPSLDDRLEERPAEMEATQQSVDLLNSCLRTRLPENVNHARMAAASRHHQPLIADMDDNGLVIIDPWIRLPGSIDLGLLIFQSLLKISGTLDLSRHQ